jgi:sterol 3beta-glucosyltransferase
VLNLYDGFTGVVTHPYRDAKKDGVVGFGKGVGRGFGGLLLKTMAAVSGLPGYTLKGIEKQIEKRADRDLKAKIIQIRLKQGLAAIQRTSEEEKQQIIKRWKELAAV